MVLSPYVRHGRSPLALAFLLMTVLMVNAQDPTDFRPFQEVAVPGAYFSNFFYASGAFADPSGDHYMIVAPWRNTFTWDVGCLVYKEINAAWSEEPVVTVPATGPLDCMPVTVEIAGEQRIVIAVAENANAGDYLIPRRVWLWEGDDEEPTLIQTIVGDTNEAGASDWQAWEEGGELYFFLTNERGPVNADQDSKLYRWRQGWQPGDPDDPLEFIQDVDTNGARSSAHTVDEAGVHRVVISQINIAGAVQPNSLHYVFSDGQFQEPPQEIATAGSNSGTWFKRFGQDYFAAAFFHGTVFEQLSTVYLLTGGQLVASTSVTTYGAMSWTADIRDAAIAYLMVANSRLNQQSYEAPSVVYQIFAAEQKELNGPLVPEAELAAYIANLREQGEPLPPIVYHRQDIVLTTAQTIEGYWGATQLAGPYLGLTGNTRFVLNQYYDGEDWELPMTVLQDGGQSASRTPERTPSPLPTASPTLPNTATFTPRPPTATPVSTSTQVPTHPPTSTPVSTATQAPSEPPTEPPSSGGGGGGGLDDGETAGLVIGLLIAAGILGGAGYLVYKKKTQGNYDQIQ